MVCCLKLTSSASSCLSLFLFPLPVTISAPSAICGTLSVEVTILPGPTVGVLLVIFTRSPTRKGSVFCTACFGARPSMLTSRHACASGDACVPVGANKVYSWNNGVTPTHTDMATQSLTLQSAISSLSSFIHFISQAVSRKP